MEEFGFGVTGFHSREELVMGVLPRRMKFFIWGYLFSDGSVVLWLCVCL